MALKVIFTPKGRHYAIHNESHQNIASVEEQTHDVTYTDLATEADKNKIDSLVDEIRRDEAEKGNEENEHSEPEKEESTKTVPAINAGRNGAEKIQKVYGKFYIVTQHCPHLNDWNDVLKNYRHTLEGKIPEVRKPIRSLDFSKTKQLGVAI